MLFSHKVFIWQYFFFFFFFFCCFVVVVVVVVVVVQELEASIFSQRQVLLDELDSLRVKESALKRQAELDKKAIEGERERIKAMSEQMERSLLQLNAQFELVARTNTAK